MHPRPIVGIQNGKILLQLNDRAITLPTLRLARYKELKAITNKMFKSWMQFKVAQEKFLAENVVKFANAKFLD